MKSMLSSWRRLFRAARRRPARRTRYWLGSRLEQLEDRLAPASHGTLATALPLDGGGFLGGTYVAGQTEYYRLMVSDTAGLAASVTAADGAAFVPRLALLSDTGGLLVQSDAARSGKASAQLNQHLLPGTYYLAVSAVTDDPSGNQGYVLGAALTPGLPPFQPLPAGGSPTALAVADFNHDGNLDLVVGSTVPNLGDTPPDNAVAVWLGNGDGTFRRPAVTYPVRAAYPYSVAAGDFNRDGNLDILAVGPAADGVGGGIISLLPGVGDGTFRPAVSSRTDGFTGQLGVGDFNRDGNPDLLITTYTYTNTPNETLTTFSLSVQLGRGDGTFLPGPSYAVADRPSTLAVSDLNHDGNPDVVLDYSVDDGFDLVGDVLSVLLGNGGGTFRPAGPPVPLVMASQSIIADALVVADFNRDGNPDVALAGGILNDFSVAGVVSLLAGNGDGTFQPAVFHTLDNEPDALAVGDVNRDGTPDIVATSGDGQTMSVLLGGGGGTFGDAATYAVGSPPFGAALGDFNHDGNLDLVTASWRTQTVSVLLGTGTGSFPAASLTSGPSPADVAAADFNRDGNLDLVTVNALASTASVLLGRGDGTFQAAGTYPVGYGAEEVAVADLNHDGNPDIVTADNGDNTVSVLLGRGDGTFLPRRALSISGSDDGSGDQPPGGIPSSVALVDCDGDGNLDIITDNNGDDTVSVLRGNGDGTFRPAAVYSLVDAAGSYVNTTGLVVGDLNHDGTPDVVANGFGGAVVSVLLGNGDGTFRQPAVLYPAGPGNVAAVALGDLDRDGNLDVVAALEVGDVDSTPAMVVAVLFGNGDGTFRQPAVLYPAGVGYVFSLAVRDFDQDGNLDVLVGSDDGTAAVLPGRGDGSFLPARPLTTGAGGAQRSAVFGTAADFNRDGNLDLVTTNGDDGSVSLLLGRGNGQFQAASLQNGIAARNVPFLQDLTGDGVPDTVVLDSSGDLLFRRGLRGAGDEFAPPVTVNPGRPARDVTVFRTAAGWAVAAVDDAGDAVSVYAWDAAAGALRRAGGFATGALPVRVAAADLTGDGLDDLAVANAFDDSVTIAVQGRDGTFSITSRSVGVAPSAITFANVGGAGGPDIVVSGQASGDLTVLLNDAGHSFAGQFRYRAGVGLFGTEDGADGPAVVSQLQPAGVAAGDFTGAGGDDLIALNRGANAFTLLRGQGQGSFADPRAADTYLLPGPQPGQVVPLTLPGDALPGVGVLMGDLGQIWVYRNNGDGTFAGPTVVAAGNAPTGFSEVTLDGQPALLVGNAYGDILTLLYDGHGGFAPDRTHLQGAPLAVGALAAGRQFAVVADQRLDRVWLYYRVPGTNRLSKPVPVGDTARLPMLAPGAVQTFSVKGDPDPYLAVANSLGNDVLLYQYDPTAGQFGLLDNYTVGDHPVSIAVGDVNGDGVPDLLVANKGSNDVSVLVGSAADGLWSATPYQRVPSGGSGPIAVAVRDAGGPGGPDLLVTNGDGTVVRVPGIGSGGKGSGFFQGNNIQLIPLGHTAVQSLLDPGTGRLFVVGGDGSLSVLAGGFFSTLVGGGVATLGEFGTVLVAGFTDGRVGLLAADGTELASQPTGFTGQLSALQALQNGSDLDVYVTEGGADLPVIVSFSLIPIVTELPPPVAVARGGGLPGLDLVLVATLLTGDLVERAPDGAPAAVPAEEVFDLFLPSEPAPVGAGGGPAAAALAAEAAAGAAPEGDEAAASPWGSPPGVAEALRQRLRTRQLSDRLEDWLDAAEEALVHFLQGLPGPPAASPAPAEGEAPEESAPPPAARGDEPADSAPGRAEGPTTAADAPGWRAAPDVGWALLSAVLGWCLRHEVWPAFIPPARRVAVGPGSRAPRRRRRTML